MSLQSSLSEDMQLALQFLADHGHEKRALGRFEIPNSDLGGFAQAYTTEEESDALRYEAHQEFIDLCRNI